MIHLYTHVTVFAQTVCAGWLKNLTQCAMERVLKTRHCDQSVCQKECGLLVPGHKMNCKEEHCCVKSLRAVKRTLEERVAGLEYGSQMARLRWNRRERSLVTQVATLQNDAQLAALEYQQRLKRYILHISNIAEQITGYCKVGGKTYCTDEDPPPPPLHKKLN